MAKNPIDESRRHEMRAGDPAEDKTEVCPTCGQDMPKKSKGTMRKAMPLKMRMKTKSAYK